MRDPLRIRALGLAVLFVSFEARAADYYVNPSTGSATNDGSAAKPWKTLEEVIQAGLFGSKVKGGDTVHLADGYHGEMAVSGGNYAPPISVKSDTKKGAKLRHVRFSNTSGWLLSGVSVSPSYGSTSGAITMIEIQTNASKVTVEDSEAFSVADATGWGVSEWLDTASNGVSVRGAESVLRNTHVKNVRFGISADASKVLIEGNTVENFSADGLRGLGDDETFQYNVVKNSYLDDSVDTNHDDGFQSWSVGTGGVGTGEVKNMTLRGNVIINAENPAQPLQGTLQGIGCFDGTFVGWVVENNVVITNHWHGISLYGARDSRVVNNTVIDTDAAKPGPPWIMVTAHKDGTPSQNVVVRNNLATDYDVSGTNVMQDHNVTLKNDLATYFVKSVAPWDLHLLPTSPAIDQGSSDQAPPLDADKVPRPQGAGVDLGAYEWHDGSVIPTGGSGGGAGTGGNAGAAGAAGGSGGTASGGTSASGGSSGAGATTGGSAGKKSSDGGDDGGCGCRTADGRSSGGLFVVASMLALCLRGRRRSARPVSES